MTVDSIATDRVGDRTAVRTEALTEAVIGGLTEETEETEVITIEARMAGAEEIDSRI